jgi:hypothetical protein
MRAPDGSKRSKYWAAESLDWDSFHIQQFSAETPLHDERRGGRTGEKSVTLILRKNRPVQHTFEI